MRKFTPYESNLLLKYGFDLKNLSSQISTDIPVEYIIRIAEFYEYEFYVNKNTLIPRIETENLIELALKFACDHNKKVLNFADVGTGSGAVGISFALELLKRNISFKGILSDISDETIKVAQKNLKEYNSELISPLPLRIIKSDLLKLYPKDKFDIIFANLPYIPSHRINQLPSSVRNYEPIGALDGGKDGLKYIREILIQADNHLADEGILLLEVDDTHTLTYTREFKGLWNIEIKIDFNGKNRFWICRKATY